jgi:hypothetical protein
VNLYFGLNMARLPSYRFCFQFTAMSVTSQLCDLRLRVEKCRHFSIWIIVEQNLDVCQLCLRFFAVFCDFRHFGWDHFWDHSGQKSSIRVGMNRYEWVSAESGKIAVSPGISAIRWKQRAPEISLWSPFCGEPNYIRTCFQSPAGLANSAFSDCEVLTLHLFLQPFGLIFLYLYIVCIGLSGQIV